MEKEKKSSNENNLKSPNTIIFYVVLGLLIFFWVQSYNNHLNGPTDSSFTDFKEKIQNGEVLSATIKAQSNTVEYELPDDSQQK